MSMAWIVGGVAAVGIAGIAAFTVTNTKAAPKTPQEKMAAAKADLSNSCLQNYRKIARSDVFCGCISGRAQGIVANPIEYAYLNSLNNSVAYASRDMRSAQAAIKRNFDITVKQYSNRVSESRLVGIFNSYKVALQDCAYVTDRR